MLDLNKLLRDKAGSNVIIKNDTATKTVVRVKRLPKSVEVLKLPGNWRHIIHQTLGDDEMFNDLNNKIQDAILAAKKPKLIGLINRSNPVSIECDHVAGVVVFMLRTQYGTQLRLYIKSRHSSLTIRLSVDGHNLLYIDYENMVCILPEYEFTEDTHPLPENPEEV